MPLFFDTNVPLGYIFKWDPWHPYVNKVFKDNDSKYWSKTVINETNKKLKSFLRKYSNFLRDLYYQLEKKDGFFKKDDILFFANKSKSLDFEKRVLVIEKIWASEGFNYEEHISTILNSLNQIIMDLNRDVYDRKNKFVSYMELHKRHKQYPQIKEKLKEKIHYPDFEIFLDAHDLCFIHSELEIITADSNEKNIEHVISNTNIRKITDLRTYTF